MPRAGSSPFHRLLDDTVEAWSERAMPATVTIVPADTTPTLNTDTGVLSYSDASAVYSGKARIQQDIRDARNVKLRDGGDASVARWIVAIPNSETGVAEGHLVTVDTARDAGLAGRTFQVVDVQADDFAPQRTLVCIDQTRSQP